MPSWRSPESLQGELADAGKGAAFGHAIGMGGHSKQEAGLRQRQEGRKLPQSVEGLQFTNIENGQLVMLHRIARKFMLMAVTWSDPKSHKVRSQSSLYQLLHSSECVHTYMYVNVRERMYVSV